MGANYRKNRLNYWQQTIALYLKINFNYLKTVLQRFMYFPSLSIFFTAAISACIKNLLSLLLRSVQSCKVWVEVPFRRDIVCCLHLTFIRIWAVFRKNVAINTYLLAIFSFQTQEFKVTPFLSIFHLLELHQLVFLKRLLDLDKSFFIVAIALKLVDFNKNCLFSTFSIN